MRYQLRYIRVLHQGEIVVPLRCMTIMHYRSATQIPGSRLRLPCQIGTPAVLVFPRPIGPVAQWKSVRFTRGRSLVRSQPGPPQNRKTIGLDRVRMSNHGSIGSSRAIHWYPRGEPLCPVDEGPIPTSRTTRLVIARARASDQSAPMSHPTSNPVSSRRNPRTDLSVSPATVSRGWGSRESPDRWCWWGRTNPIRFRE